MHPLKYVPKPSVRLRCPRMAPVATLATLAFAAVALAIGAAAAADDSEGSRAFDQYCISCHGPDGRGVENLGLDLVDSGFVAGQSEEQLVDFLKTGRLPDETASKTGRPMPDFSWVSESELRAIAAFIKSRAGKG